MKSTSFFILQRDNMETRIRYIVEELHGNLWTPWHDRRLNEYRHPSLESAISEYGEYKQTFHYCPPKDYRYVRIEIQPEQIINKKIIETLDDKD